MDPLYEPCGIHQKFQKLTIPESSLNFNGVDTFFYHPQMGVVDVVYGTGCPTAHSCCVRTAPSADHAIHPEKSTDKQKGGEWFKVDSSINFWNLNIIN